MAQVRSFMVSGAASGIGRHMALRLARQGHGLTLLDQNAEGLEAARGEAAALGGRAVQARVHDVRDAAGWDAVVQAHVSHHGALDVMLNIAGYLKPGYAAEIAASEIELQVDVNVKGVMYATAAGARQMLLQGHGHIVNIASIAGISAVPGLAIYAGTKHAVRGYTLSVAHELSEHGVQVSVVCPDAVETPMLELQVGYDEAAMTFGGGRGLTLDEVGRAIERVLDDRRLELVLPVPGSGRGVLARIGNLFPALATLGISRVRGRGRRAQRKRGGAAR